MKVLKHFHFFLYQQKNKCAVFVLPTFSICMLKNGFLKQVVMRRWGPHWLPQSLGAPPLLTALSDLYTSWAWTFFYSLSCPGRKGLENYKETSKISPSLCSLWSPGQAHSNQVFPLPLLTLPESP